MSRRNNHKISGILSRPPVRSRTKRFRSGIRVAEDRTFILPGRQKGVFIHSCGRPIPCPIHLNKIHCPFSPDRNPSGNPGERGQSLSREPSRKSKEEPGPWGSFATEVVWNEFSTRDSSTTILKARRYPLSFLRQELGAAGEGSARSRRRCGSRRSPRRLRREGRGGLSGSSGGSPRRTQFAENRARRALC